MAKLVGKEIGPIGFGLMSLNKPPAMPHEQAFAVMKTALAAGANFWNGGDFYGTPDNNSLHLVAAYFTKYPEDASKVVLSIKGGVGPRGMDPDGSEAGARAAVENAVKILGTAKRLDIFEYARVDPKIPIEETLGYLAKLRDEGLFDGICLSEVSAATVRRAAKVTRIEGVELELSLWATQILDNGTADACRELGIPVIAYSPIGKGFLTGRWQKHEDLPQGDIFAKMMPRLQKGAFEKNIKLVEAVKKVAEAKGCTPAQLAIAWVRAQGLVVPIPGATKVHQVQENMVPVTLTEAELAQIKEIVDSHEIEGNRYPDMFMDLLEG